MKNIKTVLAVIAIFVAVFPASVGATAEPVEIIPPVEDVPVVIVENGAVIPLWALGPNQNLVRANFPGESGALIWDSKQVHRDAQDNFFVDGYHISLTEFKTLGINADFVGQGETVSLLTATTGVR